jgi:hypothetical protein
VPYVLAVLIAIAAITPAHANESPQKPGRWQIKAQMEMPGMPVKMPAINTEICVTEEDLKDPQKAVPNDPKAKCTISDYKVDGKSVTWTVDCPKQGMKGNGQVEYTDETFAGWTKMLIGEQEMTTKYSGKWLGECKK